jgi:hypothetical protein
MESKVAKYFVAHRVKGMSKAKAVKVAGISTVKNVANYERLPAYKALEARYGDRLLGKFGIDEAAEEHVKIMKQDRDLVSKLNALKYYKEQVQPEEKVPTDEDQMIVVLRA